jgi:4a-hydroxytetrahydrobiopterin dehydratase
MLAHWRANCSALRCFWQLSVSATSTDPGRTLNHPTTESLCQSKCKPCEGGTAVLPPDQAAEHLRAVPQWSIAEDGKSIARQWKLTSFVAALSLCNRVGEIAEVEQHHPDLHLTGYRQLRIELTTHAINGLSVNDFILAAKIDAIKV